jgi:hypothetical protein
MKRTIALASVTSSFIDYCRPVGADLKFYSSLMTEVAT